MAIIRVSLGFMDLPDADLDAFTENVIARLTDSTIYTPLPVALADLEKSAGQFTDALAAAAQGGKQLTAAKEAARAELVELLRTLAFFVQGKCKNDLSTLLLSGFEAVYTNHAQSPLPAPVILKIKNEASGQLVLQVKAVDNARSYEVRYSINGGPPQSGGIFTQARRIVLENLTPGTTYTLQVRAVGGSTGYSPWSESVSHMAT